MALSTQRDLSAIARTPQTIQLRGIDPAYRSLCRDNLNDCFGLQSVVRFHPLVFGVSKRRRGRMRQPVGWDDPANRSGLSSTQMLPPCPTTRSTSSVTARSETLRD